MKTHMKANFAYRMTTIAVATAVFALHTAGAIAAPMKKGLETLANRSPASAAQLPTFAKAQSGITGTLNPGALSAPVLDLTLADGTTIQARLQRVAQDNHKGTQSWVGTFDDSPGSILVLSKAKGVVSGFANYGDQTLELRAVAGGKHVLYEVDSDKLPQVDGVRKSVTTAADTLSTSTTSTISPTTTTTSTAVVQDLLVVYTAAAANTWGQATLQGMIQNAVQSALQAYQNSNVNVTLNLVGLQQVAMTESGSGMSATLTKLTQDSAIRSLRDKLSADMVVLVTEDKDYCGWSSLMMANGNTDAYSVVWSSCLSGQSLAHEVGHLQGLDHNRENGGNGGFYPYGYGYRVCASNGFRDIMSYNCTSISVPRVLQFSNPNVYYNGYATGISYDAYPSTSAETWRALNNSATKVAAYRTSTTTTPTVPTAPSSLAASTVAYNSVALRWSDNSTDETGFTLERSGDGVNFSQIATLGAGTVSFTDGTVTVKSNYYYRVRAYNSVGGSAYSNTLAVTTPDVPPAPPTAPSSVAALNDADGTASVQWVPACTTATGYDVMREKWDTRKGVWTGATTVASVPSTYTSIVDASGTGTYRYSVRAKNAGGASAYAGPASVTVTSSTSSSKKGGRFR
jgi:peptidyl-Asp metalloendopeptidase